MKFFTPDWFRGAMSDEESDAVFPAYREYLDKLMPEMPATVRALAKGVSLHDGLLRSATLDRGERALTMILRCGDLQVGHFDLTLRYTGADVDPAALSALRSVARDPKADVREDEIDREVSGSWIHRILFLPYREVTIRFQGLGLSLEPMPNCEFERGADVFSET